MHSVVFLRLRGFRSVVGVSCLISLTAGVFPGFAQSQDNATAGIHTIRVELDTPAKVKLGKAVRAHTVEPLYDSNEIVIPAGTVLFGKVSAVTPVSKGKRANAISHGDFTPLHEAAIQFNNLRLQNGSQISILTLPAQASSQVVRFQGSHTKRPSLIRQGWNFVIAQKNQAVTTVTAPGKVDRLKTYVFSQLPWHPEVVEAGSQYDVALLTPVASIEQQEFPGQRLSVAQKDPNINQSAYLHARLQQELSSKTGKRGDLVSAMVTQPVLSAEGQIEIPQGAILRGRVLQAHAAEKWGKNGALRFTFNQVDFPQGAQQQVSGVPAAVDGSKNRSLKLDTEGGVEPDTKKGVMLPLTLGFLALSAFSEDEDGGMGRSAVASNGFGLITRIVAISTGSRTVGGVVGMIDTGRTVYSRFIARGRDVVFPRNSQVEVEVGPIHKLSSSGANP
ncbi:MAG TPA: hypothetical protein VGN39_05585 [Terriglobales bacterium]|nr:hypothetical protein [Terriglobales bacterium]